MIYFETLDCSAMVSLLWLNMLAKLMTLYGNVIMIVTLIRNSIDCWHRWDRDWNIDLNISLWKLLIFALKSWVWSDQCEYHYVLSPCKQDRRRPLLRDLVTKRLSITGRKSAFTVWAIATSTDVWVGREAIMARQIPRHSIADGPSTVRVSKRIHIREVSETV